MIFINIENDLAALVYTSALYSKNWFNITYYVTTTDFKFQMLKFIESIYIIVEIFVDLLLTRQLPVL